MRKARKATHLLGVLAAPFFLACLAPRAFAHHPHDEIVALAVSPAFARDGTLFIINRATIMFNGSRIHRSVDGGYSWKQLVRGLDHRTSLTHVVVSPAFAHDGVVFVATDGDGVYRSADRGDSWRRAGTGPGEGRVALLAVHPDYQARPHLVAVGADGGVHFTDDGGGTWREVLPASACISALAFLATSPDRVVAGSCDGTLYESTDGARTWTPLCKLPRPTPITAVVAPRGPGGTEGFVVASATPELLRVSRPVDARRDRSCEAVRVADLSAYGAATSMADDGSTSYVTTWHGTVLLSTDGGWHWEPAAAQPTTDPQANDPYAYLPQLRTVCTSPNEAMPPNVHLAGFDGLFRQTATGSWLQLPTLSPRLITGLAVAPTVPPTLALPTYGGGIHLSEDGGRNWRARNRGLATTRIADVTFSPAYASDHTLFTGEVSGLLQSRDQGHTWTVRTIDPGLRARGRYAFDRLRSRASVVFHGRLSLGEAFALQGFSFAGIFGNVYPATFQVSPGFAEDRTLFVASRDMGIYRSTDGGDHFAMLSSLGFAQGTLRISPDFPRDRMLLIAHQDGLWRSTDAGDTWAPVTATNLPPGRLSVIEPSPAFARDRTIFAASGPHLYRSTDGGASWTDLEYGAHGLVIALTSAPASDGSLTVLISVKGHGLYLSRDGGDHFTPALTPLADHAVESFRLVPSTTGSAHVYAASIERLFESFDGGNTWRALRTPERYEDNREELLYGGVWLAEEGADWDAHSIHHSDQAGATVTLPFVGTGIVWFAGRSPTQGRARVTIDGATRDVVSQYSAAPETTAPVFTVEGLAPGVHELRIEVLGEHDAASRGSRIEIDALEVVAREEGTR